MIPHNQDPFGHAILDYFEGKNQEKAASFGCRTWFSDYNDWFEREKNAITHAKGNVLDIGCAAGRHTLYLQEQGHEVVAVDNSPLAIDVCRRRGVRNPKVIPVTRLSFRLGIFDTILMLGNNFGLLGNRNRGQWLLRRFKRMTPPGGIILAGSGYDLQAIKSAFGKQVKQNIRHGRLPGAIVFRKQYRRYISEPIKWLYASPDHMCRVLRGTGWMLDDVIKDDTGAFVGIIHKESIE